MGPKKTAPRILSKGRRGKSVPSAASGSSSATAHQPPPTTPTAFRGYPQVIPQNVRSPYPGASTIRGHPSTAQQPTAARGRGKAQMNAKQGFQRQLLIRQEQEKRELKQQRKLENSQLGSFFLWLSENRDKLEKENPHLAGTSYLVIKAGKIWKSLTPTEKLIHDSKVKRTSPAFILSLIELGREDFDEEFQGAKAEYDALFPTEPQVKVEVTL